MNDAGINLIHVAFFVSIVNLQINYSNSSEELLVRLSNLSAVEKNMVGVYLTDSFSYELLRALKVNSLFMKVEITSSACRPTLGEFSPSP